MEVIDVPRIRMQSAANPVTLKMVDLDNYPVNQQAITYCWCGE